MALTLLRVKRLARGLTIVQAAAEADVNSADFGRIERLDRKPSRRIAAFLSQKYRLPIEQLLAPLPAE